MGEARVSGVGKTRGSVTVTCSLSSGGMISPCTTCASQVSQCTYGMYTDTVTRKGKNELNREEM